MRSDVLRRVRWANVALTLGTLATLATVIAWPLTATPPPSLPADAARPADVVGDPAGRGEEDRSVDEWGRPSEGDGGETRGGESGGGGEERRDRGGERGEESDRGKKRRRGSGRGSRGGENKPRGDDHRGGAEQPGSDERGGARREGGRRDDPPAASPAPTVTGPTGPPNPPTPTSGSPAPKEFGFEGKR
jgi:hypothetical protein